MGMDTRGQPYSHKLLQLLALHAGSELALLVCVEAIIMSFVSIGTRQRDWHALFSSDIECRHTYPSIMCDS